MTARGSPLLAVLLTISMAAAADAQEAAPGTPPESVPQSAPESAPAALDEAEAYRACMALARTAPEQAFETALSWQSRGGGSAAVHCSAVALLSHGQYADAGLRFEELADGLRGDELRLRVDALAQAGQAWLLAGDYQRAHIAQSEALEADPGDPDLWIDRALTRALAENYWEAIDDLNEAENLAPQRADLLIFRASAYRFVEAFDLALEDAERGLQIDPDNPEGLLERGNIRRLLGDEAGARADWLQVVTLAEGSPAAESAQANLAALDVKAE